MICSPMQIKIWYFLITIKHFMDIFKKYHFSFIWIWIQTLSKQQGQWGQLWAQYKHFGKICE